MERLSSQDDGSRGLEHTVFAHFGLPTVDVGFDFECRKSNFETPAVEFAIPP